MNLLGIPVGTMLVQALVVNLLDVPRHVEEERREIFGRLDVAHVYNPSVADAAVVGTVHLALHHLGMR